MASYPLFRQIAKAMALGDGDRAADLIDSVPDNEIDVYQTYITAVFAGAAGHRFDEDHSHEAIRQFVSEARLNFQSAQPPLKALVMEGLFRVLFGEEHLLDEITPDDQLRHQFLAIRKIVGQSDHMQEHLDEYLADAETLAKEWTSEDE